MGIVRNLDEFGKSHDSVCPRNDGSSIAVADVVPRTRPEKSRAVVIVVGSRSLPERSLRVFMLLVEKFGFRSLKPESLGKFRATTWAAPKSSRENRFATGGATKHVVLFHKRVSATFSMIRSGISNVQSTSLSSVISMCDDG